MRGEGTGPSRGGSRAALVGRLLRGCASKGAWQPLRVRRLGVLVPFVLLFLLLQLVHWVGFLLDEVFFRGYRRVRVREPLFVVGLPRSGTSFLQRVLDRDERFTTPRLWEMVLAPSVTERKLWAGLAAVDRLLGRPLGRLLDRAEDRAFAFMDEVHPLSLRDPEEDQLLLLPVFACSLLVVPFPLHPDVWRLTRFDHLPEGEREAVMSFYRSCLQRHLYVVGAEKRVLSKNPSFTAMVGSLERAFPDARFLCCVRDPREAVPSLLSSLEAGARAFGWAPDEPEIRERFVAMMEHFAGHGTEVLDDLPPDRRAFVPLAELHSRLAETVEEAYARFGWKPGPEFRAYLQTADQRARNHESRHAYGLKELGLSRSDLERRFAPFLSRFGFDPSEPPPASPPEKETTAHP